MNGERTKMVFIIGSSFTILDDPGYEMWVSALKLPRSGFVHERTAAVAGKTFIVFKI